MVTAAGDNQVRVMDISQEKIMNVFTCHRDRAKRISVIDSNVFLSCSEDGTVRLFDMRAPHQCGRGGCPKPLIDFSKRGIDLNGMSVNKWRNEYVATGGSSSFLYLHDTRCIRHEQQDWGEFKFTRTQVV